MPNYQLSQLDQLEAEAIFIFRETAAQFENPALLFSGGKDSIVMAWLARKAFWPARMPFPLVHIDTGHNFHETMTYRDEFVDLIRASLVVGSVQDSIDSGRVVEEKGPNASRNKLQTITLLDTIELNQYDACLGGGRRDEEKARAKERFFSHRDDFGQWDPKNQRPEIWNLYNGRLNPGENMRVFPLSNWTEMDVWEYIKREKLEVPSIYFSHQRRCVRRGGQWVPDSDLMPAKATEEVKDLIVRVRTIGDIISTGCVESPAANCDDIIAEIAAARVTERGSRADDRVSEAAMEDRKKAGYF